MSYLPFGRLSAIRRRYTADVFKYSRMLSAVVPLLVGRACVSELGSKRVLYVWTL